MLSIVGEACKEYRDKKRSMKSVNKNSKTLATNVKVLKTKKLTKLTLHLTRMLQQWPLLIHSKYSTITGVMQCTP